MRDLIKAVHKNNLNKGKHRKEMRGGGCEIYTADLRPSGEAFLLAVLHTHTSRCLIYFDALTGRHSAAATEGI